MISLTEQYSNLLTIGQYLFSKINVYYIFFGYFTYLVIRPYINYYKNRDSLAPGPLPLPLIGHWNIFLLGDVAQNKYNLSEKYGEICDITMFGQRCVLISSPKYLLDLFSPSVHSPFLRRLPLTSGFIELGMDKEGLLLNCDIPKWRHNRKFFQQSLSPPSFIELSTKYTVECCEEIINYWDHLNEKQIIRLDEWFRSFTSDMMGLVASGSKETSMKIQFMKCTNQIVKEKSIEKEQNRGEIYRRLRSGYPDALGFYIFVPKLLWNFPGIKSAAKHYKNILDYLTEFEIQFIKERKQEIEHEKEAKVSGQNSKVRPDFLTMLISQKTDDTEDEPSPDDIKQNIREMFSAGTGTTTTTLCSIVYLLAKHPEHEKRMLEEILSVIGEDERVSSSNLSKLTYTEAIINESMRLYPVVPITYRYSPDQDTQIANYHFSKDTIFAINLSHIHRNGKYFANPDKFIPERFIGEWKDRFPRYAFSPFGHGMRSCPGKNFAMTEIKVILATIYRKYTFKLVNPDEPLRLKFTLVNDISKMEVYIEKRE